MKILSVFTILLCFLVGSLSVVYADNDSVANNDGIMPSTSEYIIGKGDILQLSVWKDPELSRQVSVLPDGTISLPLVGQLVAAGKTVRQLEDEVTKGIKNYLPSPVLDVSVVQVNSMIIYVIGKVRAPGRFPVSSEVNVLQALSMAGGLDRFADEDDMKIYREKNGQTKILLFDYTQVIKGEQLQQNIRLRRGDVIVIP